MGRLVAGDLVRLIVALAVPLGVGALGATLTVDSVRTWYPALVRPAFAPPSWVFGPVWTTLYLMMGVASWLVWRVGTRSSEVRAAMAIYALQLVINLAWSWMFFGLKAPLLALCDIVLLLALIAWTIIRFHAVSVAAAWLLVPYLGWVAFATALNAGFWWLNR